MLEVIHKFLDSKNITDGFLRGIVIHFITEHDKLFGKYIPFSDLMCRLEQNLKSIDIVKPESIQNIPGFEHTVGRYEGFEKNTISMYFENLHIENPALRDDFVVVLLHELAHCAYTIKQKDLCKTETHVFVDTMKLLDGKVSIIGGTEVYIEPIINYVASRIYGRKNNLYVPQTLNIEKLANIIGEENIITSAFYSNLEQFKRSIDDLKGGAYEYFTSGMRAFNWENESGFKRGNEIMENFYKGNIPVFMEFKGINKNA